MRAAGEADVDVAAVLDRQTADGAAERDDLVRVRLRLRLRLRVRARLRLRLRHRDDLRTSAGRSACCSADSIAPQVATTTWRW